MTPSLSKLLRGQKQRLRTLLYPLQRRLPVTLATTAQPRAIMVFDPSTKYGGWIDRVKGMISVYELARLTGRTFQVHTGSAFPLDGMIEPATFDWRVALETLRWNPFETRFHVSRDRWIGAFPALRASRQKTIFIETNLDYLPELHPELDKQAVRTLWGDRYRELFRPSASLEAELAPLVDRTATAIHARFTSLLGDFKDVTSKVLDADERTRLLAACVERVRELARTHRNIIVFSDSTTFLAAVDQIENVRTLPGRPTHLDHEARVTDSLRKTLVDFHVMVACERIIQLRLGEMYDSNFSRYASYINDVPFIQAT